ncbi:MAG: hypothetical protein RL007_1659 [Bacteroidota bacterium]
MSKATTEESTAAPAAMRISGFRQRQKNSNRLVESKKFPLTEFVLIMLMLARSPKVRKNAIQQVKKPIDARFLTLHERRNAVK